MIANNHSDFSELVGKDYLGWVSSEAPKHTILNFYAGAADGSAIENVFVYLLLGQIAEADVECDPYFSALTRIDEMGFPDNPKGFRKWVFYFEKGSIAFFYEHVSFQTESTLLSAAPTELLR